MSLRQQIFLNGNSVELSEALSIPRTYSIVDVREPEKRTTNYSKTTVIPGTANNNVLFAHLFDVHVSVQTSGTTSFNPNLKASVSIIEDGAETFSGYLQLNRINVTNHYGIEYECTMFGNLANIFQTLGDKRLNALDFSEYAHTYNKTNQVNSWNTSVIKNGANYVNFSGGLPTGEGYVYPMIDYGHGNGTSFNVVDFFPAVYLKTVIDKIFNANGFQYQSAFFNSQLFKSLVIPYGGQNLTLSNAQAQARGFRASLTNGIIQLFAHDPAAISVYPIGGIESFNDDSTPPNWDTGNNFNTSTFKFVAPNNGTYKIDAILNLSLTHFPSSATVTYGSTDRYTQMGQVIIRRNLTNPLNATDIGMLQGANSFTNSNSQYWFNFHSTTLTSGTTNCSLSVPVGWAGYLHAGDSIDIYYQSLFDVSNTDLYNKTGASRGYTRVNLNTGSYFTATIADPTIVEGDTVSMTNVLPDNIKQADLLTSVIRAFNLYVDNDKTVANKLILEPRDDFYSSGTTRDWSAKLDYSQPLVITPMGELDAKNYIFQYKQDGDYYNDYYFKRWNEIYGYRKYSVTNDFIKDDRVTELIFSPTPLADYVGIDRVISKIFTIDSSGNITPKTSNLRLLYYGGVKTTANNWSYVSTSGTVSYNTYAYAGHLDDPSNPTIDLSFDVPREVFYTALSYTDNNLFNHYWKNYIDEITDKDSKMVVGYFNLTTADIANLSFYDVFYFENDLFILNKIYDYDPSQNQLTKCEFIKLIKYPAFVTTLTNSFGGPVKNYVPQYTTRTTQNGNVIGGAPIGFNNYIAQNTNGCRISGGTQSTISEGCNNVTLINTSGVTVNPGVQNLTVINSSGTTYSTSNQVVINGVVQADTLTPTTYTPTLSGGVNVSSSVASSCQYMRVGNVVTVSGLITLTVTSSSTTTSINISVPIASAFASSGQCGGAGGTFTAGGLASSQVFANPAAGNVTLKYVSNSNAAPQSMYFTFTYQII